MFYQRVVITPALGKANEVRSLLVEKVNADNARMGGGVGLLERVLGEGIGFIVGIFH